MCFNRKALVGLGAVAIGVLVLAPGAFAAALPVLVLLACPLSMLFMMRAVGGSSGSRDPGSTAGTDEPSSTPAGDTADPELVRLRAEVDQLRAELGDRHRRSEPTA